MPTSLFATSPHARFIAFIAAALLFLFAVRLGLLIPIYSGLLVYVLVKKIAGRFVGSTQNRATWIAVSLVTAVVVLGLLGIGFGLHVLLAKGRDVNDLALRMSEILDSARNWLPAMLRDVVPEEQATLLAHAGQWLREHAAQIGSLSLHAITGFTLGLIGILLGALISVGTAIHPHKLGPITQLLFGQIAALRESFWRVASAQVKISSLNTLLTGIYLAVILPAFGVQLPFTKTLIVITFVAGLLPVIGNLISNTVITIISLSHSLGVAVGSLGFLIVIHKFEYFANARFVGEQIDAKAFELLLAMVFMERLFGPVGVVAAPVFYAWLKSEWIAWDKPAAMSTTTPTTQPACTDAARKETAA